jgi:hypothetical protein
MRYDARRFSTVERATNGRPTSADNTMIRWLSTSGEMRGGGGDGGNCRCWNRRGEVALGEKFVRWRNGEIEEGSETRCQGDHTGPRAFVVFLAPSNNSSATFCALFLSVSLGLE